MDTGKVPEVKPRPLTSMALSKGLEGSVRERLETEEKTILVKMTPGQRPEVTFTGFWNAKFIRAAMNSLSKQYRLRKFRPSHPEHRVEERGGN